jgi:hypothetical protein
MQNAKLPDGSIINAKEYIANLHKGKIICPYCEVPAIHVVPHDRQPFFKTTGRGKSKHKENCPEYRDLSIMNSINKIKRYSTKIEDLTDYTEYIFNLNLDNIDIDKAPHGKIQEISSSHPKKKYRYTNKYNDRNYAPAVIKTLALLAKLIKDNNSELDKIVFNCNGRKYLIEEIIIDQNKAFDLVSTSQNENRDYVVYGKVRSVVPLKTVKYINFDEQDGMKSFTAVIFKEYFPFFTCEDKIIGKPVLIAGKLKLNKIYNQTEIIVKSDLQINTI